MYLLDTCAFLYYLDGNQQLSDSAKKIIDSDDNVFLSQVSLWEIAVKKTIKKLVINESISDLERICYKGGIEIIPIKNKYFDTIQILPYIHGDPFDRLILATAIDENLSLITDDGKMILYPDVQVIW
ncbi:MAG: type II toxin-antitoxin system VapC family toxin [Anaerolineaceae bacterium]|nr:type II toxin-antitoxin system VapC family toxin [Anaerolineaceae bacterium]